MARKRKKRAAPRARRRGESVKVAELEQPVEPPTPAEEWSEVVDSFREMLQLESKTARRQAMRLMHALEREALAIFKVARRLGAPDYTPKDYDKLRAHYARSAISVHEADDDDDDEFGEERYVIYDDGGEFDDSEETMATDVQSGIDERRAHYRAMGRRAIVDIPPGRDWR